MIINEDVQLIHGDCLEVMKSIPAGSVDLILCDLPYGEVSQKSSGLRKLDRGNADRCEIDLFEVANHFNWMDTGIVTYNDENMIRVGSGICSLIDGRFPDIDRVIQKETAPTEQIGFNAKYLADVEKLARLFNPKFEAVLFELNGNTSAAVANISAPTGETAKVIVMPMRI